MMRLLAIVLVLSWTDFTSAATIVVPAGGDVQGALNTAQYGDTVVVQAGASYPVNLTLPLKSGDGLIVVQSSSAAQLPDGVRVGPAQAALFARFQSVVNAEPVIKMAAGAHGYRFIGIEMMTDSATRPVYDLVRLGESDTQTALTQAPRSITIDRSYIHGWPTQDVQRGIALNCADCGVTNSYISDIHGQGYDTQAICGWNGPGPFTITNNYLEAAGENVMFGGAPPSIPNLVPSDITITGNSFYKPLSWRVGDPSYAGIHWTIKNLLELKNAQRVTISGNTMENSWPDAQVGYGIILNASTEDSGAWNVVQDITITHNQILKTSNGLDIAGGNHVSTPSTVVKAKRITIADNSLDIGYWSGEGKAFVIVQGSEDVTYNHNTVTGTVRTVLLLSTNLGNARLQFLNQLTPFGAYGVFGDGGYMGTACFTQYAPDATYQKNALYARPADDTNAYPAGNYFPATAADATSLLGTDGLPVGVRTGTTPTPTPTPAPTPAPTPQPSPSPTPLPSPTPPIANLSCTVPATITMPQWSSTTFAVVLNGLTTPTTITAYADTGQVTVSPSSQSVAGTSASISFRLDSKKKSSGVSVATPCGTKRIAVTVQ